MVCVTYNLISLMQEKIGQQHYQTLGTLRAQLLAGGAGRSALWLLGCCIGAGVGRSLAQPRPKP